MKKNDVTCGIYQHYRTGSFYEVMGYARHSETHEEMIVYKALYHCSKFGDNQVWVRSKEMFIENVVYDGNYVPRFKKIKLINE